MFDRTKYTVGWVCALSTELTAARLHLDCEHDSSDYEADRTDDNVYIFGNVGKHNVVVATLPKGEYGISSATGVAVKMIASFENLRVGIMVGIAGGAPLMEASHPKKQDVRLGDVVVGVPGLGEGGVCQYDFGKAIQGQEFLLTGHLDAPPASVLAAVSVLETDFEMEGNGLDESVSEMLKSKVKLAKKYRRPNQETDQLFCSSFNYSEDHDDYTAACKDPTNIVERPLRDEDEDTVVIHYGLIGSANSLMKDAGLRNSLASRHGIMCFEMEAAGLMNQMKFLVVRGVCDYSDSHKNKIWQGYAALTAAAYARALLLRLPVNKVHNEAKLADLVELKGVVEHVAAQNEYIAAKLDGQTAHTLRNDIERWLAAPDPSLNYNAARKRRHDTTGSWVFTHESFRSWLNGDNLSPLWFYGTSGCGKTVLSSTIIEYLNTTVPGAVVLYYYFDVQDFNKQKFDNALRSLILQFCSKSKHAQDQIEVLRNICNRGSSQPGTLQLDSSFVEMCKDQDTSVNSVLIVLDALDECAEREELLPWIEEVSVLHAVSVIVTSRPETDIEISLKKYITAEACVELKGPPVDKDIEAFIHASIYDADGALKRWSKRRDIQDKIAQSLTEKADGMFRWVACQFDVLKDCTSPATLERELQNLPRGLHATYDRIVTSIPEVQRDEAIRVLQFLLYSERPLTVGEMVDIVIVRPDHSPAFDEYDRMPVPLEVGSCCRSLVRVVDTIIQLAHASVREYLLTCEPGNIFYHAMEEKQARTCLVNVSLAYLHDVSRDLRTNALRRSSGFVRRDSWSRCGMQVQLAAFDWISHALRLESTTDQALEWTSRFLADRASLEFWHTLSVEEGEFTSWEVPGPGVHDCPDQSHAALITASKLGLVASVRKVIQQYTCERFDENILSTALKLATEHGHLRVAEILLVSSANRDRDEKQQREAIQLAASGGHLSALRLLIEKIDDADARRVACESALLAAAKSELGLENAELIKLLLEFTADIDAQDEYGHSALILAAARLDCRAIKILLEAGADVNAQGGSLCSALQGAASYQIKDSEGPDPVVETIRLLISKGANVNAQPQDGNCTNALQAAVVASKDLTVVKFLLQNGAKVNAQGGIYGSALIAAVSRDCRQTVELLCEEGADVNMQSDEDGPALQQILGDSTEMAELLLKSGADINLQGGSHGNALSAAAYKRQLNVVKLLLRHGADVNARAGKYGSPLAAAAAGALSGDPAEVVELLLGLGADVHAQGGVYGNALQAAAVAGSVDAIRMLLSAGADVNAQGGEYGTALQASLEFRNQNHEVIVPMLFEYGAVVTNPNIWSKIMDYATKRYWSDAVGAPFVERYGAQIPDRIRESAFVCLSFSGKLETVKALLKQSQTSKLILDLDSALLLAANSGHVSIVKLLLEERPTNINQRTRDGRTLIEIAIDNGDRPLMEHLLTAGADIYEPSRWGYGALESSLAGWRRAVREHRPLQEHQRLELAALVRWQLGTENPPSFKEEFTRNIGPRHRNSWKDKKLWDMKNFERMRRQLFEAGSQPSTRRMTIKRLGDWCLENLIVGEIGRWDTPRWMESDWVIRPEHIYLPTRSSSCPRW